ncbi:hypothetical protein LTT66_17945 [Nocardia gipuzkoensis]|uniref:hypothetical protein n=1 Tax=Nocardia gipuzkoensis TaxID=2749991 RepID=UPI001E47FC00|nr:hypothetical protein [Nocardia gipuzkoensis]UGT71854.1 hypothetical protein LTT66_17945 [Nocardia gipuzkoensis]
MTAMCPSSPDREKRPPHALVGEGGWRADIVATRMAPLTLRTPEHTVREIDCAVDPASGPGSAATLRRPPLCGPPPASNP